MKRFLSITMVLAVLIPLPSTSAQTADTTCADFTYQEEAQRAFDDGEGQRSQAYMTGMDEDNDGIACEHLPPEPAAGQILWSSLAIVVIAIFGMVGYWWTRRDKGTNEAPEEVSLFPGRTSQEEVEDELALLKADKAIDDAGNLNENP